MPDDGYTPRMNNHQMHVLADDLLAALAAEMRSLLGASGDPMMNRVAGAAENWRWECVSCDEAADPVLAIAGNEDLLSCKRHPDGLYYRVGLRSLEEYPPRAGAFTAGNLVHLVAEVDDVSPEVARHMARHDPAFAAAQVGAWRTVISACLTMRSRSSEAWDMAHAILTAAAAAWLEAGQAPPAPAVDGGGDYEDLGAHLRGIRAAVLQLTGGHGMVQVRAETVLGWLDAAEQATGAG